VRGEVGDAGGEVMRVMRTQKASIRQNRYCNWYGYIGGKRVVAFSNTIPRCGMQQSADEWLLSKKKDGYRT